MQIILTQEEIEEAIEGYVRNQINIAENQKVAIDLKSTRGETGFTAILDIRTATAVTTPAKPKPVTRSAPVEVVSKSEPEKAVEEASIPETSEESMPEEEVDEVAAAIPDAPKEAAAEPEEAPKPKAGSIFNFAAGKAGA